jgi:hypothetical protein
MWGDNLFYLPQPVTDHPLGNSVGAIESAFTLLVLLALSE